jgi:hypothetical protein
VEGLGWKRVWNAPAARGMTRLEVGSEGQVATGRSEALA